MINLYKEYPVPKTQPLEECYTPTIWSQNSYDPPLKRIETLKKELKEYYLKIYSENRTYKGKHIYNFLAERIKTMDRDGLDNSISAIEGLKKDLNEWVESIPAGQDGTGAECEQTGEPFKLFALACDKEDGSVLPNFFEHFKASFENYFAGMSGLVYWRQRPSIKDMGDGVLILSARVSKAVA